MYLLKCSQLYDIIKLRDGDAVTKKQKINKAEKEYYEYIKSCPDWYWVHGLHDAKVLNITKADLLADYNIKDPKYNRMEILLDCDGALFEMDIKKIILYNHKIVSGKLPDLEINEAWWISDRLSKNSNGKYLLELELATNEHDRRYISKIEFQLAEVLRK